jgi:hypothetical protein
VLAAERVRPRTLGGSSCGADAHRLPSACPPHFYIAEISSRCAPPLPSPIPLSLLSLPPACRPLDLSACLAELSGCFPEACTWLLDLALSWADSAPPGSLLLAGGWWVLVWEDWPLPGNRWDGVMKARRWGGEGKGTKGARSRWRAWKRGEFVRHGGRAPIGTCLTALLASLRPPQALGMRKRASSGGVGEPPQLQQQQRQSLMKGQLESRRRRTQGQQLKQQLQQQRQPQRRKRSSACEGRRRMRPGSPPRLRAASSPPLCGAALQPAGPA